MKRLIHAFAAACLALMGMNSALAQTDVVISPQVANPAAVTVGVSFTLNTDWEVSSTSVVKGSTATGLPVWTLNTVAVRSVVAIPPTPRKVELTYPLGPVAPGTGGRLLWKFNGQTLKESSFTVPGEGIGATASITVTTGGSNTANGSLGTTAKVHVDFKEYAAISSQKAPVREGNRFILEATAARVAVIQIFPPPPLPSADLNYTLGAVAAGEYVAVFKLNGAVLAEKPFAVPTLPPPVQAMVTSTFDPTATGTVARVRIVLPDPYYELADPGLPVIEGQNIRINATLNRINTLVALPSPKVIEKSYSLGLLLPAVYTFNYQINGSTKLLQTFTVERPAPAPVQLAFVEVRPSAAGQGYLAEAGVLLTDPALSVTDWGTLRRESNKFTAAITTGPRLVLEPPALPGLDGTDGEWANNPLLQAGAPVAAPGDPSAGVVPVRIERHRYELGLLEPGIYQFELTTNGKPIGLREFRIQTTPPPPGPVVADIAISHSHKGTWLANVRLLLPAGQAVLDWGQVQKEDNQFKVSLTIGPVPVSVDPAANIEPVRFLTGHVYDLGPLAAGIYSFAVYHGENQLALRPFRVEATPPPPPVVQPRLAFLDIKQGGTSTAAEVGILLPQPGYSIVSWGNVSRDGNRLHATVQIKRDEVVPAVILPPSLERHVYSLGALEAGEYKFALHYQLSAGGEISLLGARAFVVPGPPPPPPVDPLPIVAFMVHGVNDQGSFIDLGLAWPLPGLNITDWGTPVRDGNLFKTTLTTGRIAPPAPIPGGAVAGPPAPEVSLLPADGNVTEDQVAPLREIGGWPASLVRHRYLLGVLPAGDYQFAVAIGDRILAKRPFTVRGEEQPLPVVTTLAEPVRRAGSQAAPFSLTFSSRSGWPSDPSLGTVIVKGPQDFKATATRLSGGIISLDPLGMIARGEYELAPPGGAWDAADNGWYEILIDPAAVKDRLGQSPADATVGRIFVQVLPQPPPPPLALKAGVVVAMADGQWTADVSFENTGGWFQASWGAVKPCGPVFVAQAVLTTPPPGSAVSIPANFSHRYVLGELKPGHYSFFFRSSAGHIGQALIHVPGIEPPTPLDAWKFNALGAAAWISAVSADDADTDGDGHCTLAEFAFGCDPLVADVPDYHAGIVNGPDGNQHIALHYRRALGSETSVQAGVELSANMTEWIPAGALVEITASGPEADGTQAITARQTAPLSSTRYPYLRIRFERTGN